MKIEHEYKGKKTGVWAEMVCDSIWEHCRISTMVVRIPRIVLAELNTHRSFCLSGDTVLLFDLPRGAKRQKAHSFKMTVFDFWDKWENGARRTGANPKKPSPALEADAWYTGPQVEQLIGIPRSSVFTADRKGLLPSTRRSKTSPRRLFLGADVNAWRKSAPQHTRFPIRDRLKRMYLRQVHEGTRVTQSTHVTDIWAVGERDVYELRTVAGHTLKATADHRIWTPDGWKELQDLRVGDSVMTHKSGVPPEMRKEQTPFQIVEGRWRSIWQREHKATLREEDPLCRECRQAEGSHLHHIVPVSVDPCRTYDESNVVLLCPQCHRAKHAGLLHRHKDRGHISSYACPTEIASISPVGKEMVFDLSVAGEYANFYANGIVVHNCRNSASSRAIPAKTMRERVLSDPYIPWRWPVNGKGMVPGSYADEHSSAKEQWLHTLKQAAGQHELLEALGVHKEVTNRLLELWMWTEVLITATEWQNFFRQRSHLAAQDPIRVASECMQGLLDQHVPTERRFHIPYVRDTGSDRVVVQMLASARRCRRVSYLKQGVEVNMLEDAREGLSGLKEDPPHLSPYEHMAVSAYSAKRYANFTGWRSLRYEAETDDNLIECLTIELERAEKAQGDRA